MNWEEIPYENIKLLNELGSGAFGIVYKGELLQYNGNTLPCAVKALKRESDSTVYLVFILYSPWSGDGVIMVRCSKVEWCSAMQGNKYNLGQGAGSGRGEKAEVDRDRLDRAGMVGICR